MIRRMATLCLLAAALPGCSQRTQIAVTGNSSSIQAARDALAEGQAGTSLAIARGILVSQPADVAALVQAGDAQVVLGDRLAAQTSYRRALQLLPHDVRARLGVGKMQIRDDLPGAEASFRAILADAPRDPQVLNDLGYVLDLQERHGEAQARYRAAIAADQAGIPPRVNLALSLALSGQPERSERMLRDIAASTTNSPRVKVDFALAQVMAGHDKEATATLLAGDLSPTEAQAAIDGMVQLRLPVRK